MIDSVLRFPHPTIDSALKTRDIMDNEELNCLLTSSSAVKKKYTNVIYNFDTLPRHLLNDKFYLCNTKSEHADYKIPGHWVTMLVYQDKIAYCDSFGLFPEPQFITTLLNQKDREIYYMNAHLQNFKASSCGLHSLVFCTAFSYGMSVNSILTNIYGYDSNLHDDEPFFYDLIAKEFVSTYYGETRSIFYEP